MASTDRLKVSESGRACESGFGDRELPINHGCLLGRRLVCAPVPEALF